MAKHGGLTGHAPNGSEAERRSDVRVGRSKTRSVDFRGSRARATLTFLSKSKAGIDDADFAQMQRVRVHLGLLRMAICVQRGNDWRRRRNVRQWCFMDNGR